MTTDQLKQELAYWHDRLPHLGHPTAKKETAKKVRDIESELNSRQA